ncbi:hypothetical protein B0T18DRAFT_201416 [Schizothecium vesticola]|uniref:Rhodopsin domain-containing protein n=1 Tax=Schizothecium vesticola TaxID=314040 RepID=A0AA40EIU9_9PEZI|nr:hypothetical protein B0T18DRAFT_201416 [Schizothecium vesticola]
MHRGIQVAIAMWAMTALSLVLAGLRVYTRLRIVRFFGVEDHLFVWTGIFLLLFAGSLQVAVYYGLGQSLWVLSLDNSSNAILWTYIANTFAIIGNALAKLSMGFFLLRVVQLRGQKITIWILIAITSGTSATLVVLLWNQTTPRKTSWDPLRTPGTWNIQIQPMSVGLGGWSSACDFFFAIFPWIFIWSLRMPRREKILLASGMSLGVIAGACGIIRTVVLSQLQISDYTLNFAMYFVWAAAEISVAMVCLGIPTLRPLYLKQRGMSIGYTGREHTRDDDPEMPAFTMCEQPPQGLEQGKKQALPEPEQETWQPPSELVYEMVQAPPRRGLPYYENPPLSIIEEQQEPRDPGSEYNAFLRDSASSHTMVEHSPSPEPYLRRPESARTRDRSDSVDDILGLYNSDRSRSRGAVSNKAAALENGMHSGLIWVRCDVSVDVERNCVEWPLKG